MLLQVDADAFTGRDARSVQKQAGGAKDEVLGIDRKAGVAALEANPLASSLEGQPITQADGLKDCLQFMEAVSPFSKDVEQKVDFAE